MSFRRRIALYSAIATAVAVALVAFAAWFLVRDELRGQVDDSLRERAAAAELLVDGRRLGEDGPPRGPFGGTEAGTGPRGPGGPPSRRESGDGIALPGRFGLGGGVAQLVDGDGVVIARLGLDADQQLPTGGAVQLIEEGGERRIEDASFEGEAVRLLSILVAPQTALQFARSLEETNSALSRLTVILLLLALGGTGAAAALGLVVAGVAIRPARRLTEAAEEVSRTTDLSRRIEVEGDDELARLAQSFNAMLGALERSVGAQKQLVADASHELRTPLTSLRTNIELLASGHRLEPDDERRLLADVRAELEELSALVDNVVDLAREPDAAGGDSVPLRLDELCQALVDRAARRRTGLDFQRDLEPTVVEGDRERLERAITNLLDNAAKWSPADGTVRVELRGGRLTVDDQGPGIAVAERSQVFDRFYRSAAARSKPGSGLGLAIVRQAVEAHGGTVRAEEAPGGGTRMIVELPGAEVPADAGDG